MPAKLAEATEFGTLETLIPSWERSLNHIEGAKSSGFPSR
jgi:hypothetical protein